MAAFPVCSLLSILRVVISKAIEQICHAPFGTRCKYIVFFLQIKGFSEKNDERQVLYEEHKRGTRTFFVSAKRAKRQMPNKREGVVIIYYIVPIHLLLSLLIIIIYIGGAHFSYFLFGVWHFGTPP